MPGSSTDLGFVRTLISRSGRNGGNARSRGRRCPRGPECPPTISIIRLFPRVTRCGAMSCTASLLGVTHKLVTVHATEGQLNVSDSRSVDVLFLCRQAQGL